VACGGIDTCASACIGKLPTLDGDVAACLKDPGCKCSLECQISAWCQSAGSCPQNGTANKAMSQLCSAALSECKYLPSVC